MFKYIFLILFISFSLGSCIFLWNNRPPEPYRVAIIGDSGRKVNITYMDKHPGGSRFKVTKEVSLPFFQVLMLENINSNRKNTTPFLEVRTSEDDTTTQAILMNLGVPFRLDNGCFVISFVGDGSYHYYSQNGEDSVACSKVTIDSVFSYLKKVGYPCYMSFEKGERVKSVNLYDAHNWRPK